jgi:hypothetical protein
VAVGNKEIDSTSDGGKTWGVEYLINTLADTVTCVDRDPHYCWAVGRGGTIIARGPAPVGALG